MEEKIGQVIEQSKNFEKQIKNIQKNRAAEAARNLLGKVQTVGGFPSYLQIWVMLMAILRKPLQMP